LTGIAYIAVDGAKRKCAVFCCCTTLPEAQVTGAKATPLQLAPAFALLPPFYNAVLFVELVVAVAVGENQ
jgi:hypothetical protein